MLDDALHMQWFAVAVCVLHHNKLLLLLLLLRYEH
jgi:hypothetical protein